MYVNIENVLSEIVRVVNIQSNNQAPILLIYSYESYIVEWEPVNL